MLTVSNLSSVHMLTLRTNWFHSDFISPWRLDVSALCSAALSIALAQLCWELAAGPCSPLEHTGAGAMLARKTLQTEVPLKRMQLQSEWEPGRLSSP